MAALNERLASGVASTGYYSRTVGLPLPYMYRALAQVGGADATRFLVSVAEDRASLGRLTAVWALGLLPAGSTDADRVLAALVQDPDDAVRAAAKQAMDARARPGSR